MMVKKRKTNQKKMLSQEVAKFRTFFTADELFIRVRKIDKGIGIATVYRFLRELRNKKHLHSYICDRRTVYSHEENNHCHFICQKCGNILHFDVENVDFLKKKIRGDICHFQIDVSGICEKCAGKG